MHAHLSVRCTAAALVTAAALISLAACGDDTTTEAESVGSAPSQSAASPSAAKPNGIEKKSVEYIYAESRKTNAAAGSWREQMSREGASTDLRISATECVGTVKLDQGGRKGSFEIIRKGDDAWAKPDAELAETVNADYGSGSKLPADGETWFHGAPTGSFMKPLVSWCHHEQITDPDVLDGDSRVSKGTVTEVGGQQVVPIVMEGTGKGAGDTVTWYTATTDEPYLLKMESSQEDMTDITFSEFGTAVNAKAPEGTIEEAPEME